MKFHLREFFGVFSGAPGDDMAVKKKQANRSTVPVKWSLQLASSFADVHLHWCRTKTGARSLLFQSSNTAANSFQWVPRTQLHAHWCSNSLPLQNLNASLQQLWHTRMHACIWEDTTRSWIKGWLEGEVLPTGLQFLGMQLQCALVSQTVGITWMRLETRKREGKDMNFFNWKIFIWISPQSTFT